MTNAELIAKIKAEIEKLKTFYGELHTDFICETLLSFLSTLELEKSVPAELEEAAHSYSESDEPLYSPGHRFHWDSDSLFGKQIETTFIAGAKWQKEQMMKEAVEGKIIFLLNGDVAINIGDIDEYKLGDKVRIIVKEKENEQSD